MANKSRTFLNGKWIDGYTPTGSDYIELFQSFYNISDDTTLGVTASATQSGYLSSSDWSTFNGKFGLNPTAVKSATYSAIANDFIPCDISTSNIGINFPVAPLDKTVLGIKIIAMTASNVVNMTLGGSDKFNRVGGSTTGSLSILNQCMLFQYNASSSIWYVIADDIPISQLTAKYGVRQIGVSIDGLGSAIQTGSLGFSVPAFTGTIQSWSVVGDTSGSVVFDVKRLGTSIVGAGNTPTITSATSSTATVSGWTSTSITEGDFIEYSISSVSSFTRLNLFIKILLT